MKNNYYEFEISNIYADFENPTTMRDVIEADSIVEAYSKVKEIVKSLNNNGTDHWAISTINNTILTVGDLNGVSSIN